MKYTIHIDGMEFTTERTPANDSHQSLADLACDIINEYEERYDSRAVVYQLDENGNRAMKWRRDIWGSTTLGSMIS